MNMRLIIHGTIVEIGGRYMLLMYLEPGNMDSVSYALHFPIYYNVSCTTIQIVMHRVFKNNYYLKIYQNY